MKFKGKNCGERTPDFLTRLSCDLRPSVSHTRKLTTHPMFLSDKMDVKMCCVSSNTLVVWVNTKLGHMILTIQLCFFRTDITSSAPCYPPCTKFTISMLNIVKKLLGVRNLLKMISSICCSAMPSKRFIGIFREKCLKKTLHQYYTT